MPVTTTLSYLLHAFFRDWLAGQRNISRHTVQSYRDTWRLFLRFVAIRGKQPVVKLKIEQMTGAEVLNCPTALRAGTEGLHRNTQLSAGGRPAKPPRWKRDPSLLARLDSL